MDLNDAVLLEIIIEFKNRSPENGFRSVIFGRPEGVLREVFGFEDSREIWVFVSGNVPCCIQDETSVNRIDISNSKATVFF